MTETERIERLEKAVVLLARAVWALGGWWYRYANNVDVRENAKKALELFE